MTEQEINAWAATVPGFKQNDVNGTLITGYLTARGLLPATPESLNKAVEDLKSLLDWEPGFEPKAPPPAAAARKKGNAFNEMLDAGAGAPHRDPTESHSYRLAHQPDRAKEAEARRNAVIAEQKRASEARLQYEEENIKIFFAGDRLNYGATEAAQKAAREKWAKMNGKTLVPTVIREIPTDRDLTRAEMSQYTKEEIARFLEKQKNLKRLAR
jgi:hypothetical protein